MIMICPVREGGGYQTRHAIFSALRSALAQHNLSGGTYTVATPAYLYTNCIMTGLRDVTQGDSKQAQTHWQWDFVQPLLTLSAAQQAQNSLMSKISAGTPVTGDPPSYSGQQPAIDTPPSGQGPSTVGAATPLGGAAVGAQFA